MEAQQSQGEGSIYARPSPRRPDELHPWTWLPVLSIVVSILPLANPSWRVSVIVQASCPMVQGREAVRDQCSDVLSDESNLAARIVERVYFPETPQQVAQVVVEAAEAGVEVTVSGGRTGITGGAVSRGEGWLISLSRMNRCLGWSQAPDDGEPRIRVQAGMRLDELSRIVEEGPLAAGGEGSPAGPRGDLSWIYPVDPTERSATIGGTIATNASGARSFHFGPTARWVTALTVVLADGRVVELGRGETQAQGHVLRWPQGLDAGSVRLPRLPWPQAKCVAGYRIEEDVDLVDLLVGSEGTLGIVVEAELALTRRPHTILSLFTFLPGKGDGLALAARIRDQAGLRPLAIEYLDDSALRLLREARSGGADQIPDFPRAAASALFLEFALESEGELLDVVEVVEGLLAGEGGRLEDTWAGDSPKEWRRMKALRHAVPEAVNQRIARARQRTPEIHKVGTDLAVPDRGADEMNRIYRTLLSQSGMEFALFGHAAENHLHANLIPSTRSELHTAVELHEELAREAVRLGGSVSAEHGIGRLKHGLLSIQFGQEGVEQLKAVKTAFDPDWRLNPGVLFPERVR